jgi:hypothetical protein
MRIFSLVRIPISTFFSLLWYACFYPCALFSEIKFQTRQKGDTAQLFIHGYLLNSSVWMGWRKLPFPYAYTINLKGMFRVGLEEFAEQVKDKIYKIAKETGVSKFQLIGHSMGGVIACAVAGDSGILNFDDGIQCEVVNTVAIGSPFMGSPLAFLAIDRSGRSMLPSSTVLADIREKIKKNEKTRFLLIVSDEDLVVPLENAVVDSIPIMRIKKGNHIALLESEEVQKAVVEFLILKETQT